MLRSVAKLQLLQYAVCPRASFVVDGFYTTAIAGGVLGLVNCGDLPWYMDGARRGLLGGQRLSAHFAPPPAPCLLAVVVSKAHDPLGRMITRRFAVVPWFLLLPSMGLAGGERERKSPQRRRRSPPKIPRHSRQSQSGLRPPPPHPPLARRTAVLIAVVVQLAVTAYQLQQLRCILPCASRSVACEHGEWRNAAGMCDRAPMPV